MQTPSRNMDLRHIVTGVKLPPAERIAAEMQHTACRNKAALVAARRYADGKTPRVQIGRFYVPRIISGAFTYVSIGSIQ
ncbi:hypothetical protein ACQUFY_06405 [Robbsia andropogonis]|uniref:hypothetical protein n=1 Tax=Robbsia andropogonis TaxID=28092 RepID=UPI003D239345